MKDCNNGSDHQAHINENSFTIKFPPVFINVHQFSESLYQRYISHKAIALAHL